ncbi:Putative molybdenum transport ATP-binding protein ModF [Seminavis robusta]|uniref:Molybdenum transport ATP-binding protein ModF n=1 Tax=Seminavis robusta TaxID=568900 RepID=A0A9N8HIY0_9STRA|nr:Putative molybdenum transport ATP-binding protein ModF [Seminavis robusta]|eukprot:Sro653_g181930.1 Putative molybdenum transport ATP-binding protein ModF (615) ;mRNA; f:22414-24258
MLRQLTNAATKRRLVRYHALASFSTAPRPSNPGALSLSYAEWAAANAAANKKTGPQVARAEKVKPLHKTLNKPFQFRYNSLVQIPENTTLTFGSGGDFGLRCEDFSVAKPGTGGHVVLGRNGTGKSLLVQQLTTPQQDWKLPRKIAQVSFDSHLQVLQDHPHRTVHDCITGGSGNLSKAAQYLVVRFGLKPLLGRTLSTLSTGEIRKSLLVSALAQQPDLLILENAFDGLDLKSRQELQSIVAKTMEGLSNSGKLLVQSVNAEYVPPAQVLLSTHRPAEITKQISTVSYVDVQEKEHVLRTIPRPRGYSQDQIMFMALGLDKDHNKDATWSEVAPWNDHADPTLPTVQDIQDVWPSSRRDDDEPLLSLQNVSIRRRRDDCRDNDNDEWATLLQPLDWELPKGQRWLVAGGNGAGKSTLTRFLLHNEDNQQNEATGDNDTTKDWTSGTYTRAATIGWVSTESHLGQTLEEANNQTAWNVITNDGAVEDESLVTTMVDWVFGRDDNKHTVCDKLRTQKLSELSQGEQKLVLLVKALVLRPDLLILDEPTQGLDLYHRRRVLALLERLCQANADMGLVYITHYEDEVIPSIDHVLHFFQGRSLYQGERKHYNPQELE